MAEQSGFFDAHLVDGEYDRVYLAKQFAKYFASFIGNGVFGGKSNELMVREKETPGMGIRVLSGQAWIDGYWYENDDECNLTIEIADGVLNRIDSIVVRWDNSERVIRLAVKKGVAASNPIAPIVQRDGDYYELKLADISIKAGATKITQANITDKRLNTDECGLVIGVVQQLDAEEFGIQLETYISEYMAAHDAWHDETVTNFENWMAEFQNNSNSAVNKLLKDGQIDIDELLVSGQAEFDTLVKEFETILSESDVVTLNQKITDIVSRIVTLESNTSKLETDMTQCKNDILAIKSAKYQQKITKTNAKTPFELTQSNVDSSKCYLEYYGSSGSPCQLNIYLASGVSFDPDTQYIIPCSTPLFINIIYDDLVSNPSTYSENDNNECTYGTFYFYLYSNDGTQIECWDSSNGCSSTTEIIFADLNTFLGDMQSNYYITKGSSTYIATSLSEITGDYLIGNTDVLTPYAGGYLYEDSEGGYIDFLLSCANNNNALSTRMYKFGLTTSPSAGIGQDISLKENTKYKFSACVKVVSGTVSQISLYIANSTGTNSTIGFKNLDISTNGIISFEFTTGSDLTNFKKCYVYNGRYDQTTRRQVLVYNMMIKEI